ncbi:MAG: HEAT repeat domain-containing protein [Planctomycetes bacterium]|nr:HEAT repeat domain-containing protein [Planctomycetota bacterium]
MSPAPRPCRAWSAGLALAALALGACTSSRSSDGGARAGVVRTEELPARERAVWEAWQKGGGRWELVREDVRRDPELTQFLVDNLVRTLVKSYDLSHLASVGQAHGPFERAADELVQFGTAATPVLVELLAVRDGIVAFLAGDVLARIGAPAVVPCRALLDDTEPETRRRAAELLGRLPHAGKDEVAVQETLAARVRTDPEWIVRAEAARALGNRGARHDHKGFALGVLGRALGDPDAAVLQSACAGLVALGERRAVPALARALRPASQRGDLKGLEAVQAALRALTGVQRSQTPEEWLAWYDAHPPPPVKALEGG